MKLKSWCRNVAIVCMGMHWDAHAAQNVTNIEFIAAGLEEHVGRPNDRVELKVYQADAKTALHTIELTVRRPLKRLLLPQGSTYRLSFESHEPDEEGATRCTVMNELQVTAGQGYRVAFTALKRSCLLSTGRVSADGGYTEIASVDGTVRRLPAKQS